MAERFVLVTVAIRTNGRLCAEERGAACPYLDMTFGACRLHFDDVEPAENGGPLRVPACLALDDRELTPEEAIAHDFGSQP